MKKFVRLEDTSETDKLTFTNRSDLVAESYSKVFREVVSNISLYVDKVRVCRRTLKDRLGQFAKITAEREYNKSTKTLMKFSAMQTELNQLIKDLYINLDKVAQFRGALQKAYSDCRALASRSLKKVLTMMNQVEINSLNKFLDPKFTNDFDYDSEIERINDQYDSLVKHHLNDLKSQPVSN